MELYPILYIYDGQAGRRRKQGTCEAIDSTC